MIDLLNEEQSKYIWKSYMDLISIESNYRCIMVAALGFKSENMPFHEEVVLLRAKFTKEELSKQLELLNDSTERIKISSRVVNKYENQIFWNKCPKCNTLLFTPNTKLCLACSISWHKE
jgi:hypothetical protein